jgi:hypothetical protein
MMQKKTVAENDDANSDGNIVACPICKKPGHIILRTYNDDPKFVRCSNKNCKLHDSEVPFDKWQRQKRGLKESEETTNNFIYTTGGPTKFKAWGG